jgi:hypothetical protein
VRVQLLFVPDCPHVESARAAVLRCLGALKLKVDVEEIDLASPMTDDHLRGWGSPTILVNGRDVGGRTEPSQGPNCRLYPGRLSVPSDEAICALLQTDQREW